MLYKKLKIWIFFIISYIVSQLLIYFLSRSNFMKSPMYIFLPVVGYFAMYFLADIIKKEININTLTLVISFVLLCLIAEYLAVYLFNYNTYVILNNMSVRFDYFKILLDSAFLEFIVSGIFGIIAKK